MTDQLFTADRLLIDAWAPLQTGGAVLVRDARIAAVGSADDLRAAHPDAALTELGDVTLMPGLIDSHVHLMLTAKPVPLAAGTPDQAAMALQMAANAGYLLDAGVTTARDLGAPGTTAVTVRDAIGAGLVAGPRLQVANAPITVTGGHASAWGGEADSEVEILKQVRQRRKEDADWIKIMATGGFMTPGTGPWVPRFSTDELRVAIEEAHRMSLRVTAHAQGTEGIRRAAEAGIDGIEHCPFLSVGGVTFDPEVAQVLLDHQVVICPTANSAFRADGYFVPWDRRDKVLAMLAECRAAGLPIIAGTDAGIGYVPFSRYVDGLVTLREAGWTEREVLAAATLDAAKALGLTAETGALRTGLAADLVAVPGDPTTDLGVLERPRLTVARGRVHRPRPVAPFEVPAEFLAAIQRQFDAVDAGAQPRLPNACTHP